MSTLALRDVHLPAAPAWWPPAPGWWLVAAVLLVAAGLVAVLRVRRLRRRRRWAALFDRGVAAASGPAARLEAASQLLRRAARHRRPQAALLRGEDWLAFLDGGKGTGFSAADGRLLLDGGFRRDRDVDAAAAERACRLARRRFVGLMERPR
ncbi:DUF4381 family protein [Stenotrophomonas mori]|uniref:DUF4381 family protein n=1 Tax=Stenotrophomonas mori TaxID=2871096 RepID=A0ABT0SDC9_9GAMM|nr:DUF4381 family protein [Stenotrophomonas mori]MCL7713121.1 DUF4381 family protein [Stenotrophomonas mori]